MDTALTAVGNTADLAAEAASRADVIVAAGGDGTINAIVRGVLLQSGHRPAEQLPALGILPFGTGNATVPAFGIPRRLDQALGVVAAGRTRLIDVGMVSHDGAEQDVFLLWLGAGLDAVVMHRISETRAGTLGLIGLLSRIPMALISYRRYPFHEIEVTLEDRPPFTCTTVMLANVGPVPLMGNVALRADASDGALEVISTSHVGFLDWLRIGIAAIRHRLEQCEGVHHERSTHIRITARERVPIQIDGDAAGTLPVEVNIKPHAIRLIVP